VPYRGGAPLNQDMLAEQIDFSFGQAASTFVYVRNGGLKAYAVMAKSRWAAAPEIPTIDEAGVSGLYASFWHGLWVPKGTAKEIIAKLNAAVRVETPCRSRLRSLSRSRSNWCGGCAAKLPDRSSRTSKCPQHPVRRS
jgi:hypothetical protein